MPMIDYECLKCKKEFEVFYTSQSARDREEPTEKCPHCGSEKKEKIVSTNTSFILKGKGWAKDRYGR